MLFREGGIGRVGGERFGGIVAICVAALAVLYPILQVDIPPLVDYPAHLARLHILSSLADSPALQRIYEANWGIVPNLAMDVLALPFVRPFGVYAVGRAFLALSLLSILGGVVCLNWVLHRKISPWPAFAALFLYNFALFWGFVNYLFSLGLVLFAISGWFATSGWRTVPRLAAFSLVATGLFFSHLFAFGIYGLTVAASEFARIHERHRAGESPALRTAALSLAQFAVPLILLVLSLRGQSGGFTDYGTVSDKALALLSPTLLTGGLIDRVSAVFAGFVLIRGFFSRTLVLSAAMKAPLLAMAAMAAVMPTWLMGTWGADMRLPIALAILLVAASRVERGDRRILTGFAACATLLLCVRIGLIAGQWRSYDAQFAEFRRAAAVIEPGSSLVVATNAPPETLQHKPYWHMAAIAVIERSVFVPTLFTDEHRHSVRVRPAYEAIDAIDVTPLPLRVLVESSDPDRAGYWKTVRLDRKVNRFWVDWPEHFDYVVIVRAAATGNPIPGLLRRVSAGSFFDIYQVVR